MSQILDTNILLDYNNIVERESDNIIHTSILNELDNLKNGRDPAKAKKSRLASRKIKENADKIIFDDTKFLFQDNLKVDDLLVRLAKKKKCSIITNDINLQIKCMMNDVPVEGRESEKTDYTGVHKLFIGKDDEYVSEIYEKGILSISLFNNEYVYIMDGNKVKDIFCYNEGSCRKVIRKEISQEYEKQIRARNNEQVCLMDLLFNDKIKILYAGGGYGRGKSFLLTSYAVQELQKGNIGKIVWIPNNSQTENTMDLGALPGTLYDKQLAYMGTLVDIIGSQLVEEYYMRGQLEIIPVSLARGRNLENAIVIVSEAENLTNDHVKLLIGRIAEGTRIFFDGDIKQADSKIFREKNGLKLLTRLRESEQFSDLFSMVKLEKTERSRTAQAADYLDSIE